MKKNREEAKPKKTIKKTALSTTLRHKIVAEEMVVNGRTAKEAVRKAGYSKSIEIAPSKVTNTKSFKDVMEKYFPEEKVAKKHDELLNAQVLLQMHFPEYESDSDIKEIIDQIGRLIKIVISEVTYPGKKGQEDITVTKKIAYYAANNTMAQDKALDKIYKLKGSYAPEKREIGGVGDFSLADLYDNEEPEED